MNLKKKPRRKLVILALAVLLLVVVCAIVIAILYFPPKVRASFSRPLVLIHNPVNHELVPQGESVLVHATARNEKGIARMELWVDGDFVNAKESPEGDAINPFVLHAPWQSFAPGTHILLVRAISADGTEGQSSLQIEVIETEPILESHQVTEGETLASIAEDYGINEEELSDLNPDLPPEGVAPGDSVDVPSWSGPREGGEADDSPESAPSAEPPIDETPPEAEESAPGSLPNLMGYYFEFDIGDYLDNVSERSLLVEILTFETDRSYEGVNCYVSLAEAPWDIVDLEGESKFTVWPDEQPLPFSASCVGIVSGGTDSLELGLLAMRIPPDHWDGVARSETSAGGEGAFTIEYRISEADLIAKEPDPDMTPPTHVHLDPGRYALRWEYHPREDEESIWGFRIYLNGNLQWVEPPGARLSDLPPEWFSPPCGLRYVFTVTAYNGYFPDGTESVAGAPETIIVPQAGECEREVMVTFHTFTTHTLPGDGRYEDRTGDIGPAYGAFYTNERQSTFDTGSLRGGANVDTAVGLTQNTVYDLSEFSANETRNWWGYPIHIVEVPDDEILTVGFNIMDEDSGSGSRGEDDLICAGETVHVNGRENNFDHVEEHTLQSRDGRCEITYSIEPAPGSGIGSMSTDYPPLPWLEVEEFFYDDQAGQHTLQIKNTGTATWPYRPLNIMLSDPRGTIGADYSVNEFGLEPGETTTLMIPIPRSPHADYCVLVDVYDDVPELYEAMGTRRHEFFCPPKPDLTITAVEYETSRLRVTVQNRGDQPLDNRALRLETILADGTPAYIAASWPSITLGPGESTTRDLIGVNENARERLANGFSVIVDPDDIIAETNEDNNAFTAQGLVTVHLETLAFNTRLNSDPRAGENRFQCRAEFYFEIFLGHGHSVNTAEWEQVRFPLYGEVNYIIGSCAGESDSFEPNENHYLEIVIPQDENVYVRFRGWETDPGENDYLGEVFFEHPPEENYGEGTHGWVQSTGGSCNDAHPYGDPSFHVRWRIVVE